MDMAHPSVGKFLLEWTPDEREVRLIEPAAAAVRTGYPQQDWQRVGHPAETLVGTSQTLPTL